MRDALAAEWVKLRTVGDVGLLLAGVVVLTAGVSVAVGNGSLLGVQVGQALAALVGGRVVGAELMDATLLADPRRGRVLAAKAVWAGSLVGAAATVAVLASALIEHIRPDRPVALSILHLILVALLGLGIGTIVRDTVVTAGVVLGVLYLMPALMAMFPDPEWQRALYRLTPATALLAMQTTVDVEGLPLSPWEALGVVTIWAAAALGAGWFALVRRP